MLLLNPDTEVIDGTFGELVALMDERPEVGLAGVRQVTADDTLWPTIRRFPSPARALGEALFSERWPVHPAWSGERVLDQAAYEREQECDWTSGSFMLCAARPCSAPACSTSASSSTPRSPTSACASSGPAGSVRHLPSMTIVHHAGKGGIRPRMIAQDAYSRKQYADKHLDAVTRGLYLGAVRLRHLVRFATAGTSRSDAEARRESARLALRTLADRAEPPFGQPPTTAVDPLVGAIHAAANADDASIDSQAKVATRQARLSDEAPIETVRA